MSRIYLDENISRDVLTDLSRRGHDVVEGRTIAGVSASDHVHLATSARLRRMLITSNERDFRLLHHAWKDWFAEWTQPPFPEHAGIVVIPQPPVLASIDASQMIADDLANVSGSVTNRLIIFDPRGNALVDPPARR